MSELPAAVADTMIRRLSSNWVPDAIRASMSVLSAEMYAAAPLGATTRTEICLLPEPKLAIAAGAYAELRRGPIRPRTAAVTTMMLERSGSASPGPSSSRDAAETPRASSAWHITGSQDTMAERLTWLATHAAARLRIAISPPTLIR